MRGPRTRSELAYSDSVAKDFSENAIIAIVFPLTLSATHRILALPKHRCSSSPIFIPTRKK